MDNLVKVVVKKILYTVAGFENVQFVQQLQ